MQDQETYEESQPGYSRLGGGRTSRMVSSGSREPGPPLMQQLIGRTENIRQNVIDSYVTIRAEMDNLRGVAPEADTAKSTGLTPTSGALGELFNQIGALEDAVEILRVEVSRLRGIT